LRHSRKCFGFQCFPLKIAAARGNPTIKMATFEWMRRDEWLKIWMNW
jgi:hypothetical protein